MVIDFLALSAFEEHTNRFGVLGRSLGSLDMYRRKGRGLMGFLREHVS